VRRRVLAGEQHKLLSYLPAERRLATARRVVPLAGAAHRRQDTDRVTERAPPAGVRREKHDREVNALAPAGSEWFRVPVDASTG
jgi:hypothetical protein